jgi:sugar lactone lactonase YvrE
MKSIGVVRRLLVVTLALSVAIASVSMSGARAAAPGSSFPDRIDLPNGFRPEGIAITGASFFVGSLANGAIYRGDLRTGAGAVVHAGAPGAVSVGLAVDGSDRVFAAGGATGKARVIDGRSGQLLKTYDLATAPTFINDVVIARGSAWFTDSMKPVLYRVPLDLGPAQIVPLTGDLVFQAGFNVNGIDATPDGKTLVLVQTNTGKLFTADFNGVTKLIDLGTEAVPNGDGILLHGRTLYVVQNQLNLIAVVKLDHDLGSGTVLRRLSDPGFDFPTTIDRFGGRLYAVNARFNATTPPAETPYWITAITTDHGGHHEAH